ncbi:unnamed protein product [Effrenium voratum]|uniref:EF-hand domain-containing protein n=1 Tax=Effrenium voratum TaxID=2562239 RepID=A0AA36MXY5_9DINO|nr:unnamed protein product [Effrenium voratum]CAJ1442582.1 unnamed protein product [Effrenium voratum]
MPFLPKVQDEPEPHSHTVRMSGAENIEYESETHKPVRRNSLQALQEATELEQHAQDLLMDDQFGSVQAKQMRTNLAPIDPAKLPWWRRWAFFVVSWPGFDTFIGLIILLNGLTIGVDTQVQAKIPLGCDDTCRCDTPNTKCQLADPWVATADNVFYGIYIAELILRFLAYGVRAWYSHWVKFDFFLVLSATVDLILKATPAVDAEFLKQVMLVRLLRLARLARLVRLIVQFQTLWKLVSGLMSCANTLFWTFLLMSILSYIAALFGMDLCDYDPTLPLDHPYNVAALENFRGLDDAMFSLMQLFTFDSIASIYRPLIQHKPYLFLYFMMVLLVLSIALMNLVTAIMVEGALAIAEEDKEVRKTYEQARKKRQMAQLKMMFEELDEDGSGELTLDEINAAPPDVKQSLFEIAGTEDIQTLFEMLDYDEGGTLETDEFCEGVFKASAAAKPLELDRLMKQCRDILFNSRKALGILNGETGIDSRKSKRMTQMASKISRRSTKDNESRPRFSSEEEGIRNSPRRDDEGDGVAALESRVNSLEKMALNMQEDTQKILDMLTTRSKVSNSNNMKRAAAVPRAPSNEQLSRPATSDGRGNSRRRQPPIVYSWSAAPPVDDEEIVALRRRVAQLEAEILKQQMDALLDVPDPADE